MLIRTKRCQSQCVRAASMVSSSVQTKKAHEHYSFPRRDCSNTSSEKAHFWATNYWGKYTLLHLKQEDSYCCFFALILEDPWLPICIGLLKFQMLNWWGNVCKERRTMIGTNSNSDSASHSAVAPEPYKDNISVLWILETAALSNRCCQ